MSRQRAPRFALAAVLSLVAGCDAPVALPGTSSRPARAEPDIRRASSLAKTEGRKVRVTGVPRWNAATCGGDEPIQHHSGLLKRTPADLRDAFGKPSEETRFKVGEAVGVFETSAIAHLPSGMAAPSTEVGEATWTKAGCNLTVWFVKRSGASRAFHALEWRVGTDF